MSATTIVVLGQVKEDGTLLLDEKVRLPAGRVQVTVQALPDLPQDPFWIMMEGIWAEQKAHGHVPRTKEEIDAEMDAMREEAEEEMRELETIHEEYERARRQGQHPKEPNE